MHSVLEIIDESTDSAGPDLVSLEDLKFALGITDSSEDAALQAAITFQSRIIAEYCDRRFGRAEALETFRFDPNEILPTRQALTLSLYPVVEVIELAGTTDGYDFDPASGPSVAREPLSVQKLTKGERMAARRSSSLIMK